MNKPFNGYVRQEYEKFGLGNVDMSKVFKEDVVNWIENGWKKVKVESIIGPWAKIGIEALAAVV